MKLTLLIALLAAAAPSVAFGQEAGQKEGQASPAVPVAPALYDEIARLDSLMFDAFNARDLDKLKTYFTADLEFYQDNEGLASYAQTIKDFKVMFEQNIKLRRELVKGSLEVYPVKDYGAIEIGVHRFCHIENGKDECGTFKFLHVWQKRDGGWKIARVISYGH